MKRLTLTLLVLFTMMVIAHAQVTLNIKLYPIQTIEYPQQLEDTPYIEELDTFGTTHYVVNKIDCRKRKMKDFATSDEDTILSDAKAPIGLEQPLAHVVYSIEPL